MNCRTGALQMKPTFREDLGRKPSRPRATIDRARSAIGTKKTFRVRGGGPLIPRKRTFLGPGCDKANTPPPPQRRRQVEELKIRVCPPPAARAGGGWSHQLCPLYPSGRTCS